MPDLDHIEDFGQARSFRGLGAVEARAFGCLEVTGGVVGNRIARVEAGVVAGGLGRAFARGATKRRLKVSWRRRGLLRDDRLRDRGRVGESSRRGDVVRSRRGGDFHRGVRVGGDVGRFRDGGRWVERSQRDDGGEIGVGDWRLGGRCRGVEVVDLGEKVIVALAFCAGDAVFNQFNDGRGLLDDGDMTRADYEAAARGKEANNGVRPMSASNG